jgi:hypothetical protein
MQPTLRPEENVAKPTNKCHRCCFSMSKRLQLLRRQPSWKPSSQKQVKLHHEPPNSQSTHARNTGALVLMGELQKMKCTRVVPWRVTELDQSSHVIVTSHTPSLELHLHNKCHSTATIAFCFIIEMSNDTLCTRKGWNMNQPLKIRKMIHRTSSNPTGWTKTVLPFSNGCT